MKTTVQVIYPAREGTTFDFDYYTASHLPLVERTFGPHGLTSAAASKGISGGPGVPAPYHAIATLTFEDAGAMKAALREGGPVMADIAKFTDTEPVVLIGEVLA